MNNTSPSSILTLAMSEKNFSVNSRGMIMRPCYLFSDPRLSQETEPVWILPESTYPLSPSIYDDKITFGSRDPLHDFLLSLPDFVVVKKHDFATGSGQACGGSQEYKVYHGFANIPELWMDFRPDFLFFYNVKSG